MSHPIASLLDKNEFSAVGLMSGTSMDGVDAALVSLDTDPVHPSVSLREFVTVPYPDELRTLLTELAGGGAACAADIAAVATGVATAFAGAFFQVCRAGGTDPEAVDFIGSHGQTVAHVPPAPQTTISGTLQLGSPGAIAALTGVTTVGDFRSGDMALGGHGAPLAPGADFLLRRSDQHNRVILNIGGIANVTFLPRACTREDVIAFDTGPGNMLVDALYRALFGGGTGFDRDGAAAAAGEVSDEVLASAMSHAYFELPPPKSTGQGEFGVEYAWQFQKELGRSDSLATAAALTAESIADALEKFIMKDNVIDEIFVTGGGVHNKAIMSRLRQRLEGSGDIRPIDELGIPADAKEAVDFALLARETIMARANVLTAVTGASRALSLGTIAFGGTA